MTAIQKYWQYNNDCPFLFDPRINITHHIGWSNPGVKPSLWQGAEPDNYNFAIFDHSPHDLKFIEEQVWYKVDQVFLKQKIQGWMSVYYIPEQNQIHEFRQTMIKIQPWAIWSNLLTPKIRSKRTLLERENIYKPRSSTNFNTEERLWQMGYYENLKLKYHDDEKFLKVVGTPRGDVLNHCYQEDNSEEVEDL